jgi:hypothetical protein
MRLPCATRNRTRPISMAVVLIGLWMSVPGSSRAAAPEGAGDRPPGPDAFPEFRVTGQEPAMATLGALFRLHFGPQTTCTLWDPWLPLSTLWPAVGPSGTADAMRVFTRGSLLQRRIDAEGYVATQQHRGLAHSDGWPFPLWQQAAGAGWHFSVLHDVFGVQNGEVPTTSLDGWEIVGLEAGAIDPAAGLSLKLRADHAAITTPGFRVASTSAPFVRVEWSVKKRPGTARAALEWTTAESPHFGPERRVDVALPGEADGMRYTMIPIYRHPGWGGTLTRLRITLDHASGSEIVLKSVITACDSRHPINNAIYIHACADYVDWTGDLAFLHENVGRMRKALRFALDEFDVRRNRCVVVPWVGHDGRSGLSIGPDGKKQIHVGRGVGNNYWDILPFGGKDFQATLYLYHGLGRMADMERIVAGHPDWSVGGNDRFDPDDLTRLAGQIRQQSSKLFWNDRTGRFVGWIDCDGKAYDYGFTMLNCEAVHLGLATPEQARSIVDWLDGKRTVAGDTSRGADIYRWRFAPRCTTRRNVETYFWAWSNPEDIPFGNQVQDGGAVLGWSYFDLMARLETRGPDDAWPRLKAILAWYDEVRKAGGYRKYYAVPGRGTLQGSGTPGGLGLDAEFFESVLVPQVMLYGFLGVEPRNGGLRIVPRLPRDWPDLTITGVHVQDRVVDLKATRSTVEVRVVRGETRAPLMLWLEAGKWKTELLGTDGLAVSPGTEVQVGATSGPILVAFSGHPAVRLTKLAPGSDLR